MGYQQNYPDGAGLSGERLKTAVALAGNVLTKAPVLILDEATADSMFN